MQMIIHVNLSFFYLFCCMTPSSIYTKSDCIMRSGSSPIGTPRPNKVQIKEKFCVLSRTIKRIINSKLYKFSMHYCTKLLTHLGILCWHDWRHVFFTVLGRAHSVLVTVRSCVLSCLRSKIQKLITWLGLCFLQKIWTTSNWENGRS